MNEFENNSEFTSEDPQDVNTAEETTAENQNTENNTTYHYSYTSENNQNQNPYYNPKSTAKLHANL